MIRVARLRWLPALAWLALLAWLPWWFGGPVLLALAVILLLSIERFAPYKVPLRSALRWGLPGVLVALQRGLGGDALASAFALLGLLVGVTLLVALEAWLDRAKPREAFDGAERAEWPAQPPASGDALSPWIELTPPQWTEASALADPRGEAIRYRDGAWCCGDAPPLASGATQACLSPGGRWLAVPSARGRGVALLDRDRRRVRRFERWRLCGWHGEEPWLARGDHDAPQPLHALAREDREPRLRRARHSR